MGWLEDEQLTLFTKRKKAVDTALDFEKYSVMCPSSTTLNFCVRRSAAAS